MRFTALVLLATGTHTLTPNRNIKVARKNTLDSSVTFDEYQNIMVRSPRPRRLHAISGGEEQRRMGAEEHAHEAHWKPRLLARLSCAPRLFYPDTLPRRSGSYLGRGRHGIWPNHRLHTATVAKRDGTCSGSMRVGIRPVRRYSQATGQLPKTGSALVR